MRRRSSIIMLTSMKKILKIAGIAGIVAMTAVALWADKYAPSENAYSGPASSENTHSASFNGSSYLEDGQIGNDLYDFTVEAWIRTSANSAGLHQIILGKQYQYNGSEAGWTLYTSTLYTQTYTSSEKQTAKIQIFDGVGNCWYNVAGTTVVNDGAWHHVAASWDGTIVTLKLYIDGIQKNTTSGCWNGRSYANSRNFAIGGQYSYSDGKRRGFKGLIDDVRLWNRVKTAQEIANNKNSELRGSETGLIAYWKLNNNGSDSAGSNDLSVGSGNVSYSRNVPFAARLTPTPTAKPTPARTATSTPNIIDFLPLLRMF